MLKTLRSGFDKFENKTLLGLEIAKPKLRQPFNLQSETADNALLSDIFRWLSAEVQDPGTGTGL